VKKVLFLSLNHTWGPLSVETELEIMLDHVEKGDDVYVLVDDGVLTSTISNKDNFLQTKLCARSRFQQGMNIAKIGTKNIFKIKKARVAWGLRKQFSTIRELMDYRFLGCDFGLAAASSVIYLLKDHNPDVVKHKDFVYRVLWSSVTVYRSLLRVLKKVQPDLVYFFNGRFAEMRPAVWACDRFNIDYCAYESGGNVFEYALFKNYLPQNIDPLKKNIEDTWNKGGDKKEHFARSWFLKNSEEQSDDWLNFIKQREQGKLPNSFDSLKERVVIFSSSRDEVETFSEWNLPFYRSEIDGIKRIVCHFENDKTKQFYLRMHPHLNGIENSQIKETRNLVCKNLKILWPGDSVDSYALLKNCDKVISFGSTMGVEACFWNKPSILIGRSLYEDLNCCYIPKNHEEVINLLEKKLEPKPQKNALPYGYWRQTFGIPYKRYKACPEKNGPFMGVYIRPNLGFKDRTILRLHEAYKTGICRVLLRKIKNVLGVKQYKERR
jgi:hypothetical protein